MIKVNPLVSIIIPVYNREHIIHETIMSAAKQSYKNIEIIVVDNKSSDSTWDLLTKIAKSDSRIKVFQNEENLGPVLNWEIGLGLSNGQYVKILWSDDLISEFFVEKALELFSPETAFIMSGFEVFDDKTKTVLEKSQFQDRSYYHRNEYLQCMLIHNKFNFPVSPGNAIFRTSDLKKFFIVDIPNTDGLNFRKYGAGNDLWLFIRTAIEYERIGIIQEIGAYYRSHNQSITVERSNELLLYYEWAKAYFIDSYYKDLNNEYKSKMFFSKLLRRKLSNIYRYSKGVLRFRLIVKYIINK